MSDATPVVHWCWSHDYPGLPHNKYHRLCRTSIQWTPMRTELQGPVTCLSCLWMESRRGHTYRWEDYAWTTGT